MIRTSCCYKWPLKMKVIMNKGTDVSSQKCEHLDVIYEISQTCVSCQHQSRYSENKGKNTSLFMVVT